MKLEKKEMVQIIFDRITTEISAGGGAASYKALDPKKLAEFLFEEYEKNKPCQHKSAYQQESSDGEMFYNVCNDCGVLFLAGK